MKKSATTAGSGGVLAGAATLYNQSWDFWSDALPVVTMCGIAAIFIMALVIVNLWKRVKALEAKQ